jgi:hypothetical protein
MGCIYPPFDEVKERFGVQKKFLCFGGCGHGCAGVVNFASLAAAGIEVVGKLLSGFAEGQA